MVSPQVVNKANGRPVKSKPRLHGNRKVRLDFTFHVCVSVVNKYR
jgi:hypothetical protein